ncbi:hypothetical protein K491DRAFT_677786 [Lophiostoma macrostomum CBS 122681]|uniref:Uncharacterized protein n=1 Tax=Lophiostoma macrostomum CBS 122681 TaxID=1314788 RepID=A0A6A6TB25_9PLEO|nr:hypothetical protein K491DRAFT_677786 [Lophiostoma macrostomum CBS 122681]
MSSDPSPQPPLATLPGVLELPRIGAVKRPSNFSYYGPVSPRLVSEAAQFLTTRTDVDFMAVSPYLDSYLNSTSADCIGSDAEKSACWFLIRITQSGDQWKIPRWHQDGRMYPYDTGRESVVRSKYGTTLLGPHTLMLPAAPHLFDILKQSKEIFWFWQGEKDVFAQTTAAQRQDSMFEQRIWLAEEYKNEELVELRKGEIIRFSWGRDDSPIHSEPDLVCDRVFLTVLYGSAQELKGMCEMREEVYGKHDAEDR